METRNKMQLNGFRVTIPEAKEENSEGHVVLQHGQNFRIELHNAHKYNGRGTPSDCEVYVQGNYAGTYQVPAGQTVILEHPIHDSGKFAAYRNGSSEARQIGLDPESEDNGLIKVVWKPGNHKVRSIQVPQISWTWPYHPNIMYPENDNYYDDGHHYTITYGDHTYNDSTTGGYVSRKGLFSSNVSCCATPGNLVGGGIGLSGISNQTFTETDALDYVESETVIYLRIAFRDESEPRPINTVYKVHSTSVPRPLR